MVNTAAKKISYDGKPVQVESAIRDGTGKIINETYLEKYKVIEYSLSETTPGMDVVVARYSGTYSNTPGQILFTIEATEPYGPNYESCTVLLSWTPSISSHNDGITILGGSIEGAKLFNYIGLIRQSTGAPMISTSAIYDWPMSIKITVYSSTDEFEWLTDWSTEWDQSGTYIYKVIDEENLSQVDYAYRAGQADYDSMGAPIATTYVAHAEYTVQVSASQQYHKPFSELSLGLNSAGNARIPRQVEIYDASGNQIQTDVTIDLTNSRITIYPTAISPAQTWTVRVTAW